MNLLRGRSLISTLLFGAICLVVVNTWLAFSAVQTLERSQFWVQHTYQVVAQVEIIMGSAKDAETGERGYLITGNDQFFEPYTKALHDLPGELETFQSLTSDNPSQQARLAEMRTRLRRRIALLQQGINLRRGGDSLSEAALSVTGGGKVEMDALRQLANDMQNEERRLLALRLQTAETSSLRARVTIGLASALDFILILLMFRYLVQERNMRVASEVAARELAEASALAETKAR